jgi:hypothetical protein
MLDSLDSLIATAAVILGLSLIVQAIQQIIKQTLDLKSTYMRAQLLALFGKVAPVSRLRANLSPLGLLVKDAGASAERIVNELEAKVRGFGFPDLHLLEGLDAEKLKEILRTLPSASDADEAVRRSVQEALARVDEWFEIRKKAFQEHYERRMKYWAFGLSAVVVLAMNADIVGIMRDFTADRAMRNVVVAAVPSLTSTTDTQAVNRVAPQTDEERGKAIQEQVQVIQGLVADRAFQLMRWNTPTGDRLESFGDFWVAAADNWLGWLAMTMLVSLGAPFWYDALKAVMGIKDRLKGSSEAQAATVTPRGARSQVEIIG